MSYIRTYSTSLVLAGTAAGTSYFGGDDGTVCNGQLMAVQIAFGGMGTVLTTKIQTVGQGGPVQVMLNLNGINSDQWFYPRQQLQNNAGVNLGTTVVDKYPVDDRVALICTGGTVGTVTAKALFFV